MRIEVDGRRYAHFVSASVEVSIESLARRFQFSAVTRGVGDIPFRPGQAARVWIDDECILTGWIEKIELTLDPSAEDVTYTVSGRDRLADVVDSNVDGLGDFRSSVAAAARAVLRFLEVDAQVIDRSNSAGRTLGSAGEVLAPDPSETAAEFLWGLASRRQVLIASDGSSNLVISNGDPAPLSTRLVHRVDGLGNNLTGVRFESDHSRRFGVYRVVTQQNVAESAFLDIDIEPAEVATTIAEHRDARIRRTRRKTLAGDAHYAPGDAKARARWEANVARAEGLTYEATVPTWRDDDGALWSVNTAPVVEDEFAGIAARMTIAALVFEDSEEGPATRLTLRRKDAYAAQAGLTDIKRRAQAAAADDLFDIDLDGLELE